MTIKKISYDFTVCKVADKRSLYDCGEFCFTAATDEELSLVCITENVPSDTVAREDGWRAFRICGTLDFSLVGILADISDILARNGIGLFAVSTYNTDYIFVKQENYEKALEALLGAGYGVI